MLTVKCAKEILQAETPVVFMNGEYVKINALIFRKQGMDRRINKCKNRAAKQRGHKKTNGEIERAMHGLI